MALAAAATTVGLSTAQTSTQRPFALWIEGVDHIGDADKDSYSLDDPDGTQPARFSFALDDEANTFGQALATQQRVVWQSFVADKTLFQGFIKLIRPIVKANYARWEIECSDISEVLDYGHIPLEVRPGESDQARILYLLGTYAHAVMSTAGTVRNNSGLISSSTFTKSSLRAAIEQTLSQSGPLAEYHVDTLGQLHTYFTSESINAPYNITDTSPDGSSTIPGVVRPEYDGLADIDAVYVYGANAKGSGLFYSGTQAPRIPPRIVPVDAPYCFDASTAQTVASAEIAQRSGLVRCSVTVEGYDGWERGQTILITSAVLGWSARSFIIKGVTMKVLSGTGIRQYELACGAPLGRLSRDLASAAAIAEGAKQGNTVVGSVGG